MKKSIFTAGIILFFPSICFGQAIELEPITINKGFGAGSLTQSFDIVNPQDFVAFSSEEAVDYSSSVDLRRRSPFGIQQDLSLRGSIFEDNTVSLESVKINDPQTGHFSLELPFATVDLEEIDVLKNSQSVNFILKKPKSKGALFKIYFGQHALWEELMSLNFSLGQINNRISIEHKSSSGGRADTDFDVYNFSFHSLREKDGDDTEFIFGSTKRDFGADSFYAVTYPQEEEHISQQFFSLRQGLSYEPLKWDNTVYLRRHTDKYILNRHNPAAYTNFHTTYVYGLNSNFDFSNDMFFALEAADEKITSTNLARHERFKKGFSLGLKEKRMKNFIFGFKGGLDYYGSWKNLDNSYLGLGYFLRDDLKLRFSFNRLWRAPSFTELYYTSPSNIGNSNLKVQRSNNFELGADFSPRESLVLSPSVFFRDQYDTIDWVKNKSSDPWQAENVGNIKAYGFDFYSEAKTDFYLLKKIGLGYTYITLDKNSTYAFSKYVFDYNRHKLVNNFVFELAGISLDMAVNFSKPLERKKYTTVDLKAQKKIRSFNVSLEGINIFNKNYQEMADIEGVGRWYKIGVEYQF